MPPRLRPGSDTSPSGQATRPASSSALSRQGCRSSDGRRSVSHWRTTKLGHHAWYRCAPGALAVCSAAITRARGARARAAVPATVPTRPLATNNGAACLARICCAVAASTGGVVNKRRSTRASVGRPLLVRPEATTGTLNGPVGASTHCTTIRSPRNQPCSPFGVASNRRFSPKHRRWNSDSSDGHQARNPTSAPLGRVSTTSGRVLNRGPRPRRSSTCGAHRIRCRWFGA